MAIIRIAHLDAQNRETETGVQSPLPVRVQNREGEPLPTEPSTIDTLLIGGLTASTSVRDLLNSTHEGSPTLTQAAPYKRFILYLFTPSAATVTLTLKGRATDGSGVPLSIIWLTLFNTSINTTTNSWHRIVMEASDGAPLGADQYRIEITSSVSQFIFYNLKGER